MKVSNNFSVQALVHKDIIKTLGEKRAANLISIYLIKELERIRNRFGSVHINGGRFSNSGIRKSSYYKNKLGFTRLSYSTHQWGNTADLKFANGVTPIEVYEFILNNKTDFPYIVRMENAHKTKTWLHIECGRYREENIQVFNP